MPLTKEQKTAAVDEIVGLIENVPTVYLTDYAGLSVAQATELRNRFREEGVDFKVVKNTLLKLAMERLGGFDDLLGSLKGPTAIAFTTEPATPARVIKKFVKDAKTEAPTLKAAFIDGAVFQADALDVLASLKSKSELVGEIVGLLNAPISNVIGALQAPGSNLVSVVKTIAEREG